MKKVVMCKLLGLSCDVVVDVDVGLLPICQVEVLGDEAKIVSDWCCHRWSC